MADIGDCTMACVMGHTNEPGCLYDTTPKPHETSAGETGRREAMSEERLAEISAHHDEYGFIGATDVDSVVAELLAEVERLNDVLHANTVIRNAAESTGRVYKSLASKLRQERDRARAELTELRAIHERCQYKYVGGPTPPGLVEVHPQYEEGEFE